MHFGRVSSAENFDSSLPPDTLRTQRFLALQTSQITKIYVGCPIWASKTWVGGLYPPKTKAVDFLREYAKTFNTVEVNSTFYHLLPGERLDQWRQQVPSDFRFCPKVYRGITEQLGAPHLSKLIKEYCDAVTGFGETLGLVFAQLPESLSPRYGALITRLAQNWPSEIPLALEFRHPGWFRDHSLLDDAINFLYRHKIATVITDTPGRRDALHLSLTQPKVMIRFQGNESPELDHQRLATWSERLRLWASRSLSEAYFFTHQPSELQIPENAHFLKKLLEEQSSYAGTLKKDPFLMN